MTSAALAAAPLTLRSHDEAQTLRYGAALARIVLPVLAQQPCAVRVWLSGALGAGKTTLVRGLLAQLGVTTTVRSPTYALLEHYRTAHCTALHVDLYRLNDPLELAALGLRDFDLPGALWLVEWPERAAGQLPTPDLQVQLSINADHHLISVAALSVLGQQCLRQLRMADNV